MDVWEEQDVLVDGDGIHTVEQPYCWDLSCWCHTDVDYHDVVTHSMATGMDVAQAYDFYELVG